MKRKLSFVLAVIMLASCLLCACGEKEQTVSGYAKKLDDKFFVNNGASEYVLVLPEEPMEMETFAAEEFTDNLERAAGYTIETVSEGNVPAGKKYVSLGNTQQFKSAFSGEDLSALDGTFSSYFISSKDDNIYIISSDDYTGYGVLYGVYDLMYDLIGYTYYHDTEIAVTKSSTVNLWSYEKHIVEADFDMRSHSTAYIYGHHEHNVRLRYINFSRGIEWDHTTGGHSQIPMFVSPIDTDENGKSYGRTHPEWFYDPTAETVTLNNNQLCWTAGGDPESLDELQSIFAEKLIEYIQINPEATFFMLGQMDTEFVCQCDGCLEAMKEWGGTSCGLQIAFVNGIIEKTEVLLDEIMPEKEILYPIYAYKPTVAAPVKKDENGNYIPYSDRVIPHEKLRVFFAPIRQNFAHAFDSPVNADSYVNLQGWDAVCDKDQLITYIYDLNVSYYFANFYNYTTLASMYTDLKEAGVSYLVSQGVSDANTLCFDELRAYCISRLMWDTELNFNELAADFIDNYYKDGADAMQELFDLITDRYAYVAAIQNPGIGTVSAVLYDSEIYTRSFINQMDRCIFDAMDAIEHLRETDAEQYELLKARIMKEYLSNIYLKINLYKDNYSDSEIAEMEQIWDEYILYWDLKKGGEGQNLTDIFA